MFAIAASPPAARWFPTSASNAPGRRLAQVTGGTRGLRVLALLAAIWSLNAFDLASTLLALRHAWAEEVNPLALWVAAYGPAAVLLYKVVLVVGGSTALVLHRGRALVEAGVVVIALAYALLAIRWTVMWNICDSICVCYAVDGDVSTCGSGWPEETESVWPAARRTNSAAEQPRPTSNAGALQVRTEADRLDSAPTDVDVQGADVSKEWIIQPPHEECQGAALRWDVPPLVAQMLLNRGIESREQARSFLRPQLAELHPPEPLPGVTQAAEIISAAVRTREKIVIYGDYDVDGITGTAILWQVLTTAGAEVSFYVPHRIEEGYGLNAEAVRSLAAEGAKLIISVDCGITAVEAATAARQLGVRLVITDHHTAQPELPSADVIVHPTVGGAYPNPDICGAGVALKLGWAIAQQLTGGTRVSPKFRDVLTDALPVAALGTVADIVPLVGENRILARCGLARIRDCRWPGVRALLESAGLAEGDVDGTDVGFKLAPRLNAAGRMGHARLAIELLTRADEARAREIALYLDEHNRNRQSKERQIAREAREMVEKAGLDGDGQRAIVLASDKWHAGVVGIVAARLVDRYRKPTVMIALDKGVGQGSARSVPHFPLHEALAACREHLLSFGGHAMAGGLKIKADAVPAFTEAFTRLADNSLSGSALSPRLRIDAAVAFEHLDERTVTALNNLGPFGAGNPKPILATDWVDLAEDPRCVGKNGDHLQVTLNDRGAVLKAIAFGAADSAETLKEHRRCRVAFEPIINQFNGQRRVELQVVDFKFPSPGPNSR